MLRPERMSKVSVTGSKRVMDDVVEAIHDLHAVHLSEYDGSWQGFESGDPGERAEEASQKLVTIRSLENILGVDPDDAGREQVFSDEQLDEELERVRTKANELDDRRNDLEDELREVEEQLDRMDPFVSLGLNLDLLGGYETLAVAVGRGDRTAVETALSNADGIGEFDVEGAGDVVAVFARPTDDDAEDPVSDALVGVEFEPMQVPDAEGDPAEHVERLRERKEQLEEDLSSVEDRIDDLRDDAAGFLLAAEEQLSIEVQKTEAPLSFATTDNSFVAEGWIPTERYDDLEGALQTAVGDHVELEELERAKYSEDGHPEEPEPVPEPEGGETSGGEAVATDGGSATTMDDSPPVVMDNPKLIKPMELLTRTNGLPSYTEFDPTVFVFLTFPVFFGFMIGDLGYGLLYVGIGAYLYSNPPGESRGLSALGGIAVWSGVFTAIFGVLYGEVFGLHVLGEWVWAGHPPLHKGLQPAYQTYAKAWLVASLAVGLLHVTVGHLLGFAKLGYNHGIKEAVLEKGSWVMLVVGVWAWIFSKQAASKKPNFLFTSFAGESVKAGETIPGTSVTAEQTLKPALELGFNGLPASVGTPALAVIGLGFVMLIVGEGMLAIEVLQAIVNVLSYARLMAVLLAKAGMAFVVNLLVFGAYEHHGEFHFLFVEGHGPSYVAKEYGQEAIMFPGLFNVGDGATMAIGFIGGVIVLVVGHLFVLALGVTSAGLQSIRLEYVEFFGKFYDGGGRSYNPFGYSREHTIEE